MKNNVIAHAASSDHKVVATHLQFRWPDRSRAKRKGSVVIGGPNNALFDHRPVSEPWREPNCPARRVLLAGDAAAHVSVRRLTARVIDTQGRTASPLGSPLVRSSDV